MFQQGLAGKSAIFYTMSAVIKIEELPPYITKDEAGIWAGITVAASRTPLEFSLAASVAVALAKLNNTFVVDEGIWVSQRESLPDEFARILSVKSASLNILNAASELYKNMNINTK